MDKYEKMKRPELAEVCRKHKLSDEGSAATLRKRIREARDAAKARKVAADPAAPAEPTGEELPEADGTEETPEDPEPATAQEESAGIHEVQLTFASLDYLGDDSWEAANRKLVEMRAAEAGCRVVGNARRDRVEGTTVTYVVPVG